tara:strand:+ start:290 stop:547 length:258 start_codon:yes stop_codon:yes gene_type:complete
MIKILKFLGLKVACPEEYRLLQFQNEMLHAAVKTMEGQFNELLAENQKLKNKVSDYKKRDEEAFQKLMEEMDIIALEYMDPIGEA